MDASTNTVPQPAITSPYVNKLLKNFPGLPGSVYARNKIIDAYTSAYLQTITSHGDLSISRLKELKSQYQTEAVWAPDRDIMPRVEHEARIAATDHLLSEKERMSQGVEEDVNSFDYVYKAYKASYWDKPIGELERIQSEHYDTSRPPSERHTDTQRYAINQLIKDKEASIAELDYKDMVSLLGEDPNRILIVTGPLKNEFVFGETARRFPPTGATPISGNYHILTDEDKGLIDLMVEGGAVAMRIPSSNQQESQQSKTLHR